jgi:hypothetical protein
MIYQKLENKCNCTCWGMLNAGVSIAGDMRSASQASHIYCKIGSDPQQRTRWLTTPYKKFLRPYTD